MSSPISKATPSPFEVADEQIGGIRVLSVSGELDLGTAPQLEQPLEAALAAGGSGILIDLSACEFIDSTGIALLVRAWQRLDGESERNGNGHSRFALCGVNDQVRRLLELSGLASSLSIHASREAALAALGR
jgi:anti-sigma B factor antagonist